MLYVLALPRAIHGQPITARFIFSTPSNCSRQTGILCGHNFAHRARFRGKACWCYVTPGRPYHQRKRPQPQVYGIDFDTPQVRLPFGSSVETRIVSPIPSAKRRQGGGSDRRSTFDPMPASVQPD